jgi:hypothetical protein
VLLLALATAARFTPPGQAFTAWVGDGLGFGRPGQHPTLRQLRHFAVGETAAAGQPAYVLVRGRAAGVGHYEFVTYRLKREPGKRWPAGARCFEVELPEARSLATAGCGLPSTAHPVLWGGLGGSSGRGEEFMQIDGRATAAVAAVEAEQGGRQVPVDLTTVPPALLRHLGVPAPLRVFVAFPEFPPHGGTVTLRARDAEGRVISERAFAVPDPGPLRNFMCRSARRLGHEGRLKPKFVARDCRGI